MIWGELAKTAKNADFVLLQWAKAGKVIADTYLSLSDIRLRAVVFREGHVYYSSAAGIMHMHNNRAEVAFKDRDVLTTVSGRRKGVNIPVGWTEAGEDVIAARLCFHVEVNGLISPRDLSIVESMVHSEYYDVRGILLPPFFRLTRMPETLKPVYTTEVMRIIGGRKTDTLATLQAKFLDHLGDLGEYTDGGYAIPADLVNRGGMFVVRCCNRDGFGGAVYQLPGTIFRSEVTTRKWEIETGKGIENVFTGNLERSVL